MHFTAWTPGAAWLTDRGRRRESNEDAVGADPGREVYVVADGLGGLPGGEVASRIAVESLVAALGPLPRDGTSRPASGPRLERPMRPCAGPENADPLLAGMGSTVVLAVGAGGEWAIAHVGDSRAYLLRDGRLCRLTPDHNVAAALVAEGRDHDRRGPAPPGPERRDTHPRGRDET